eukprot:scaffold57411_cov65-Phaeocystis_antarctica.AAC.2
MHHRPRSRSPSRGSLFRLARCSTRRGRDRSRLTRDGDPKWAAALAGCHRIGTLRHCTPRHTSRL